MEMKGGERLWQKYIKKEWFVHVHHHIITRQEKDQATSDMVLSGNQAHSPLCSVGKKEVTGHEEQVH